MQEQISDRPGPVCGLYLLELPGFLNIHHTKRPFPPVKRLLGDVLFPAGLPHSLASVHFPQDADLVFLGIPFAFHCLAFLASQTNEVTSITGASTIPTHPKRDDCPYPVLV